MAGSAGTGRPSTPRSAPVPVAAGRDASAGPSDPNPDPVGIDTGSHVRDARARVAEAVDAILPQTQCRRCGYADCRAYAEAIATDAAPINRCPPGGTAGIERLAALTGRPPLPLDPACGLEAPPRLARIDEAACIGCRVCLAACPVDAIVGGRRSMHVVIPGACTGCELCVPACPVDCIAMVDGPGPASGPAPHVAALARERYGLHVERRKRAARQRALRDEPVAPESPFPAAGPGHEPSAAPGPVSPSPRSLVEAALARARGRAGDPAR